MLDLDWERSIPIIDLKIDELKDIFAEFDKALTVTSFKAIRLGCRNSNIIVYTNKGKFLLRITNINDLNNENAAYQLVKDRIKVPNLLFYTAKNKANIFIYQYIAGASLQKLIIKGNQCEYSLLEQVAKTAAIIHNTPIEKTIKLTEFDVPPFEMWYPYFINNPTVRIRIGEEICGKIQQLIFDKQSLIPEIDGYKSFIHCDFRPANMLVDENNQVYFVDWESACTGHSLADVGQFFRYRSFFKEAHIKLFEQVYNTFANRKLPDNWFELSLLRDLINPLQMLSLDQEAPVRNADLINIMINTLAYWDY
ncbi:MAG: aminoglycoside phosphotransferase family protein [Clostridiaceae bacterium]|nr:aminoglycoside phosphotransferase family protein [Clostridiaceae bacterium]